MNTKFVMFYAMSFPVNYVHDFHDLTHDKWQTAFDSLIVLSYSFVVVVEFLFVTQ